MVRPAGREGSPRALVEFRTRGSKEDRKEADRLARLKARRAAVEAPEGFRGVLAECVWLGGTAKGAALEEGIECLVLFTASDEVMLCNPETHEVWASESLRDVTQIRFEGTGKVTRDGGFIGGGFGVAGAAKGILFATALNQLTRRTTIRSVVFVEFLETEWILATGSETPEELRISLSKVFGRLRALRGSSD